MRRKKKKQKNTAQEDKGGLRAGRAGARDHGDVSGREFGGARPGAGGRVIDILGERSGTDMTGVDVPAAPEREHADVLADHLALNGKAILDVGCGAGRITRIMAQLGADVIGIDPGDRQLARAPWRQLDEFERRRRL